MRKSAAVVRGANGHRPVPSRFLLRAFTKFAAVLLATGALGARARTASGQSLLDRSDNISGDWVGSTGTVYFNFVHRFTVSPAPEHKVTNLPTFLVAAGIASKALVGLNYATNSALAPQYPNEYEFFGRYAPVQQEDGAPVDLGGQVDYNLAVKGVDGEVSLARQQGPLRLTAVTRLVADTLGGNKSRFSFGGGTTIRLNRFIALAGDLSTLTSREPGEKPAWSAGIHIALPNTPHTLSLHASNANTSTIQGLSRGGNRLRYGFEFTIPLTLRRFFSDPNDSSGHLSPALPPNATDVDSAAPPPGQRKVVKARMKALAFDPGTIEISAGTTVEWTNLDPLQHTITAVDKSFSSRFIPSDGTYSHTFTTPGTYILSCVVHPFMRATIVVK